MSIHMMSDVFKRSKSKGTARVVLLALANYSDEHGKCWPSLGRLARDSNVARRNVINAINALEELGEVERAGTKTSRNGVNVYHIKLGGDESVTPPQLDAASDDSVTPASDDSVIPPVTTPSPKPTINHQLNRHSSDDDDNETLFFLGEVFEVSGAEAKKYRKEYPNIQNLMADCLKADRYWSERHVTKGDEQKVLAAWFRKTNEADKAATKKQLRLPAADSMGARRYETWTADEKEMAAVWINRGQSAYSCGLTPGHVDGLRKEGMLT